MTKRDVIKVTLDGGQTPYVPWSFSFTLEAREKLVRHFGSADLEPHLHNHLLGLGNDIGFFENLGDDWGQQQGLQMGPQLWREFIYPELKRMYGAVRDAGKYVFIHSCGDKDVHRETRNLLDLGRDGGYILSPAHAVEGDVPLENMLAFIDEALSQPGAVACGMM